MNQDKKEIITTLSETFKELYQESRFNKISDLAEDINISRTILYDIFNVNNLPNIKTLTKIANYFNVTLNFLLGLDDKNETLTGNLDEKFYNRLIKELERQHTSFYQMCKDLGFSENIKLRWKKGNLPQTDILVKIAKYLSVSVDYLVGRKESR